MKMDVRDRWLQNVGKYLAAVAEEETENLQLPESQFALDSIDFDQVLAELMTIQAVEMAVDHEELEDIPPAGDEDGVDPMAADMKSDVDERLLLYPRSYRFFYGKLLEPLRLWKRPPHNHCARCAEYEKKSGRLAELTTALLSTPACPEHAKHSEVVVRAGGPIKAWEEVRTLQLKLPDLKKHVDWDQTARAYLKKLRDNMPSTTVEWQLDYGGVNDSANKKVSVWSATVISSVRDQEHFDFFFDQAPSKGSDPSGTAKKDGLTGRFMLGEMLDKEKSPRGDGVSLFASIYPEVTDIVLSGDTGNGYRAYLMLQELSTVLKKYGYKVKLIPLAPGHAWNRTDARIAHMNTFLNIVLEKSRVFGAIGVAAAFRAASDPRLKNQRKFMARSHIFFVVVEVDRVAAKKEMKLLGAPVVSSLLDGGKMGVR